MNLNFHAKNLAFYPKLLIEKYNLGAKIQIFELLGAKIDNF